MMLLTHAHMRDLLRVWFYWYTKSSPPDNTGKAILSLYVSTIDRIMKVDSNLINQGIAWAARYDLETKLHRSPDQAEIDHEVNEIIDALVNAGEHNIPRGQKATAARHILEALIARMMHDPQESEGRIPLSSDALYILDFLEQWSQEGTQLSEQVGGASAVAADVLTKLNEKVVLWTAWHSSFQATRFDPRVQFLVIHPDGTFSTRPAWEFRRVEDPEIRNYSLEFVDNPCFTLYRPEGETATLTAPERKSDRIVATSPGYRYFDPVTGKVDRERTAPSISHILAADPVHGPSVAGQLTVAYPYWFLSGLHSVWDAECQASLEEDLRQVPPQTTIHVEIGSAKTPDWYVHTLKHMINSAGINLDDLDKFVTLVDETLQPVTRPPIADDLPDLALRRLIWLACVLNLERLYAHGLTVDYLVRRQATDKEMKQEVQAILLAKIEATNRARSAKMGERPYRTFGVGASNLADFADILQVVAYPSFAVGPTLEDLQEFMAILRCGWFNCDSVVCDDDEQTWKTAVIPVGLFRKDPPGLKWVGSGDTVSALSFIFGCFKTHGLKRQRQPD
jgi:ADP-dependent phosphofructokinase/glucokinase